MARGKQRSSRPTEVGDRTQPKFFMSEVLWREHPDGRRGSFRAGRRLGRGTVMSTRLRIRETQTGALATFACLAGRAGRGLRGDGRLAARGRLEGGGQLQHALQRRQHRRTRGRHVLRVLLRQRGRSLGQSKNVLRENLCSHATAPPCQCSDQHIQLLTGISPLNGLLIAAHVQGRCMRCRGSHANAAHLRQEVEHREGGRLRVVHVSSC